ncbi:MAG: alpha-ketoglutarate-dependent dioxygenase AlkB family protein [Pseudomonadota bacterium]
MALIPLPDGELRLLAGFLSETEATALFDELRTTLAWQPHRVKLFGREHLTPRLCAWYGDAGIRYAYSGQALEALPWPPALARLRTCIEAACGHTFNSVLCNLYRDGADSMGWHSDDEASLGSQPVIASLSLGATRRFALRHRARRHRPVTLALNHGDLLVMAGDTQQRWQHAVSKTRRPVAARINLTFRRIYDDQRHGNRPCQRPPTPLG